MKTSALKQKLHDYIDMAEEKKLKAIYTILENDIEENYDWRNDKELLTELDKRQSDLETGLVMGISWEDVKMRALGSIAK
jgi:hypothetical protein